MTTIALAAEPVPHKRPSNSGLFRRLLEAAPDDASDAVRDFCIDVIAATLYSPRTVRRKAGTVFLLFLDALNDKRAPQSRVMRWKRFVTLLDWLTQRTESTALKGLLAENADLLAPSRVQARTDLQFR